ncbi:hypothetical protein Dsin_010314 [Dipteronia sinensis]|uniref:Transmembrane protein n=1 Tax=Dipteronia sinensis TaxID=43782 RepID=A0AAE0ATK9_9ROSI|nr:hypothetical protein Dsin_010314 [Dipteronia sinensis]
MEDMETESKHTMMKKQKLEVFDILKEALTIPYKHINFFIFTIIISLPLFCFMVYYETFLLSTLVETTHILTIPIYRYNYNWLIPDDHMTKQFNKDFGYKLIQLGLLYLVPRYLLELFSVLVTVDLASKIYNTEERSMTLKEMIHKPVLKAGFRGTCITYLYVLFFSTCTVLGLIWLVIHYCVVFKNFSFYVLFAVLYGASFIALLTKYLEWSAMWNMSVVISMLEEIYGAEALALSAYFNRGSEERGQSLMLVFFVWGLGLRLPCLILGCHESGNGIIVQVLFSGLGNVIKWVACMIYFYDCKKRILEKKVDEEVGVLVQ